LYYGAVNDREEVARLLFHPKEPLVPAAIAKAQMVVGTLSLANLMSTRVPVALVSRHRDASLDSSNLDMQVQLKKVVTKFARDEHWTDARKETTLQGLKTGYLPIPQEIAVVRAPTKQGRRTRLPLHRDTLPLVTTVYHQYFRVTPAVWISYTNAQLAAGMLRFEREFNTAVNTPVDDPLELSGPPTAEQENALELINVGPQALEYIGLYQTYGRLPLSTETREQPFKTWPPAERHAAEGKADALFPKMPRQLTEAGGLFRDDCGNTAEHMTPRDPHDCHCSLNGVNSFKVAMVNGRRRLTGSSESYLVVAYDAEGSETQFIGVASYPDHLWVMAYWPTFQLLCRYPELYHPFDQGAAVVIDPNQLKEALSQRPPAMKRAYAAILRPSHQKREDIESAGPSAATQATLLLELFEATLAFETAHADAINQTRIVDMDATAMRRILEKALLPNGRAPVLGGSRDIEYVKSALVEDYCGTKYPELCNHGPTSTFTGPPDLKSDTHRVRPKDPPRRDPGLQDPTRPATRTRMCSVSVEHHLVTDFPSVSKDLKTRGLRHC
jgi:hypothetical protein